jgi:hypothetical protein
MKFTLMKAFSILLLLLIPPMAVEAQSPTARQYFTELRDAGSLNTYADEYVCFQDSADSVAFAVVSTTDSIAERMKANGDLEGANLVGKFHGLSVQTYNKGVANGKPILYDAVEGEDGQYQIDFDAPIKNGRMVYLINWKTGRYRLKVFALAKSKDIPVAETAGKCELIHGGKIPPQSTVEGSKP